MSKSDSSSEHCKLTSIENDHLFDWSPEEDCCRRLTFRQPVPKPSLASATVRVVETSAANNSPSQDSNHSGDHFQARYVTPGFKPFSYLL